MLVKYEWKEHIIFFKLISLELGQELKLFYITETSLKLRLFSFKCIKNKKVYGEKGDCSMRRKEEDPVHIFKILITEASN
jgi:hypothetical protein